MILKNFKFYIQVIINSKRSKFFIILFTKVCNQFSSIYVKKNLNFKLDFGWTFFFVYLTLYIHASSPSTSMSWILLRHTSKGHFTQLQSKIFIIWLFFYFVWFSSIPFCLIVKCNFGKDNQNLCLFNSYSYVIHQTITLGSLMIGFFL